MTRPCLAAITLDSKGGGVATVSRLLWQVFQDRWGSNSRLFTLVGGHGDEPGSLESSTVARVGFGSVVASAQVLRQCAWMFYSHLAVARVQQFVPAPVRRPYAVFLHGIEAWRNLPGGMRRVIDGASLRVANSHFTARRVAEAHPGIGPIAVCPLALPPGQGRTTSPQSANASGIGPRTVILVARMNSAEHYKGHDELIEAWPAVIARVPDAQLVFVGGGDDVDRLRTKASALGVGHAVLLTGFVSAERLSTMYEQAAMFAMPSRGEGFGLVYLEAMTYGLPCIGSMHDAAGEIIDDGVTGFLVDQTDTDDLADRIVQLLEDQELRRTMGAEGKRRLEREFSYEQFSRRLLTQIEATLGDPMRELAGAGSVTLMSCKVLHVIPALAPRYGGPSAAVVGMCRVLIAGGVPTLIASTDADGRGRLTVSTGQIESYSGVPAIFFPRVASESFKWSAPLEAWLRARVPDFDIVHVHAVFSHSSLAAGRACRAAGVPYIVRPLGTLDPWSLNHHRLRKQLLFRFGVRNLLMGAAAMHYTSDEEGRLAESVLPWLPKGAIVPLGIDDELFVRSGSPLGNRAPSILVLSRVDAKKGMDLLIQAFHEASGNNATSSWTLDIAGDGDPAYVAHLRRLAESGPARSRIVFHGWVQGEQRMSLFRRASVFALPSHQENFGIAVVEAMANGVPVIVSPGVNIAGDIKAADAGWVVERDVTAWREALRAAMRDPDELAHRGEQARALADRFRWSAVGTRLSALYQQILSTSTDGAPAPRALVGAGRSGAPRGSER